MVYGVFNCMDIHQLELFLAVMDASNLIGPIHCARADHC
jgi:hypothetical protein